MKNSDTYLRSETSPLMFVDSSKVGSYVIGITSDLFASHVREIYYYFDDIRKHRRYLFDSSVFRSLNPLLFTEGSPVFCFSPQFYELTLSPNFQIPMCCPSSISDTEAYRIKSFLCKHSASAYIRPILTNKK